MCCLLAKLHTPVCGRDALKCTVKSAKLHTSVRGGWDVRVLYNNEEQLLGVFGGIRVR